MPPKGWDRSVGASLFQDDAPTLVVGLLPQLTAPAVFKTDNVPGAFANPMPGPNLPFSLELRILSAVNRAFFALIRIFFP
jgi:hypothetical protein